MLTTIDPKVTPQPSPSCCEKSVGFFEFVAGIFSALNPWRRRPAPMTHAEFAKYAAENPPADEWYDEDFNDVGRPPR